MDATKRDSMEPTKLDRKQQSIVVESSKEATKWKPQQQTISWANEDECTIREPYDYIAGLQGKNFRGNVIRALQTWMQVPELSLEAISECVAMLHNASLLIDDIEDCSELRRGFPSAHMVYGIAQTINAGNYIYFQAMTQIQRLNNPELISVFLDEIANLHRGQGLDLYWRDSSICPSQEQYLEMVKNKTGGLFRLLSRLMLAEASVPLTSEAKDTLIRFFNIISMAFQVLDDYKNLCSSSYTATKGFAEDLTEGKFSFPVLCALNTDADPALRSLVRNVLKTKTSNSAVKLGTIRTIETLGGFDRTREVLKSLLDVAHGLLDDLESYEGSEQCCYSFRQILLKLQAFDE